jgi:hypothetical protein
MTRRTRRDALKVAGASAALVIPAGAVAATGASSGFYEHAVQYWKDHPESIRRFAGIAPTGTDPHIGWWAERQRLNKAREAIYGDLGEDELGVQQWALEEKIAETMPTTPEGLAIVATVCLVWAAEVHYHEVETKAGITLARYFLAGLPPAVLQRAGLEGVA